MVPDAAESPAVANDSSALDNWRPSPDAPVVRTLSIAGIAGGDHDLGVFLIIESAERRGPLTGAVCLGPVGASEKMTSDQVGDSSPGEPAMNVSIS